MSDGTSLIQKIAGSHRDVTCHLILRVTRSAMRKLYEYVGQSTNIIHMQREHVRTLILFYIKSRQRRDENVEKKMTNRIPVLRILKVEASSEPRQFYNKITGAGDIY